MPDGSYFLTRYDDLVEVYRDTRTWSSDKKIQFKPNFGDSLLYEHHTTSLVFNDPPIHTRVRKLLAPAFTPRALKALQPRIEALVDRLLDAAAERGTHRPDRGFRRRDPGAAHRRHARHSAGRARPAAQLVAENPRRARAGAVARSSSRRGVDRGRRVQGLSARSGGAPPARGHAATTGRNPLDADRRQRDRGGRRRRRPAVRAGAAAQLHLPAQRRPRDHHQPDRQRRRPAAPPSRRACASLPPIPS